MIEDERYRIKIGYTSDSVGAKKRMRGLTTGNASKLRLLSSFHGEMKDEKAIHKLLSSNRTRGEWFYGEPRDYKFSNCITLMKMDGIKILGYDVSEINNFMFLPEFSANNVFVPNLKLIHSIKAKNESKQSNKRTSSND